MSILIEDLRTHQNISIEEADITIHHLDDMSDLMDPKIRDQVLQEVQLSEPGKFFRRYAELAGPRQAGILWHLSTPEKMDVSRVGRRMSGTRC